MRHASWAVLAVIMACGGAVSVGTSGMSAGAGGSGGGGSSGGGGAGGGTNNGAPWGGPEGQWSLHEREIWIALEREIDGQAATPNEYCGGTNIVTDYNYESFRGHLDQDETYGTDVYYRAVCGAPIAAIGTLCQRGAMQQQAVRGRIQRIECIYKAPGTGANEAVIDGNTLRWTFNNDTAAGSEADRLVNWIATQL